MNRNRTPRRAFHQLMRGEPVKGLYDMVPTAPVRQALLEQHRELFPESEFSPFVRLRPDYPLDAGKWGRAYERIGYAIPGNSHFGPFGLLFARQKEGGREASAHLEAFLHPLAEVEDFEAVQSLPWPDLEDPGLYAHISGSVAEIHDNGGIAVGVMDCTVFEHAWYLRSMDQLFLDWLEENPIGEWLMDWFTRRSIKAVEAFANAGVDIILLGDDIGTQQSLLLSPSMWRTHLQPRLAKVIEAAKTGIDPAPYIAYHSDGAIQPLIPDLIDTGVQILNPLQPECMDPGVVFSEFHDRLAFWGGIGTQTTLPFGTPEEVANAVEELHTLADRYHARLIPAPTHYLEPDVPLANIVAFIKAARQNTTL